MTSARLCLALAGKNIDPAPRAWCDVAIQDPDFCDTCSGEGDTEETDDDTVSLCSWTTDQGDWDGPSVLNAEASQIETSEVGKDAFSREVDVTNAADPCVTFVPIFMPMAPFWQMDQYYGGASVAVVPQEWWSAEEQPQQAPQDKISFPKKHDHAVSSQSRATTVQEKDEDDSSKTTLIFRNWPKDCGRDELVKILDAEQFNGLYDFVHMPIEFHSNESLGYAVVNLISHGAALRAKKHFQGFDRWPSMQREPCDVAWNNPLQGRTAHVERYRNSPLMHHSVPEYYRPLLFRKGARVPFPRPTTRVRAPRIRNHS